MIMSVPLLVLACLFPTLLLAQATNAAAEMVKVSTIPIFPQIPRGQTSKDFQVLVRVEAPPAAEKMRVPIDLVTVLDVGGSMRLDLVKAAMKFVIRQLHDDDRLAIVGPSNSELDKEHKTNFLDIRDGRKNARKKVDELEARGDDEFTSGLEEAVKILDEQPPSSNSRASFVILVTDREDSGRLNKLPRDVRAALKKHPVHTFGFGASHDPKALLDIAQESHGGTYSFVHDQNLDKITGALAVCLGGLNTVVAVGTHVSLKGEERSGVKIERIESGGYKSPISNDKATGDVAIGVLYAGEVKSFIVHLHVPAPESVEGGGCDEQQLLTASFHHYSSDSNTPPIQAVLSVQRPGPQAAAVLQKAPFPMVVNHIVQFSVLEMVANFVKNEIWNSVSNSITVERGNDLGIKLQLKWEQFVQAHQFWSGLDLVGLESEINAMVITLQQGPTSILFRGSMLSSSPVEAYIYSWLSSYQTQRPTAMGSPHDVVVTFITLDMQLTLQQAATNINDGGCPECDDNCVEPLPPPMFQPSGRDDNTYHLNAAYRGISLEAINQAMNQMYLAVVQASNLRLCHSSGAGILLQPQLRGTGYSSVEYVLHGKEYSSVEYH